MAIEVTALASGSKGNAILVTSGDKRILIDCGINVRTLQKRLAEAGTDFAHIDGILLTHEHIDHVKSVAQVTENYGIPVYANELTLREVKRRTAMRGGFYYSDVNPFILEGLEIRPFRVSHDAVYPVGYSIADGKSRFVYATDLGYWSPTVAEMTRGADIVLIESNHDVDMLLNGPYPRDLKERILSTRGHLSNAACLDAVKRIADSGTRKFILGHLSENNNTYALAHDTTVEGMAAAGAAEGRDYELVVATQNECARKVVANDR